ncbi:MAG: LCP family protein [Bacillota bacterium]|nr:LCP family protein [Bacillota bacterium]
MKRSAQQQHREPFERLSSAQASRKKRKKTPFGKAVFIALIVCSVLVLVGIAGAVYVNQLLNLVDRTPATGDPNLDETDLVDPGELVDQPDSSDAIIDADKDYQNIGKIDVPKDPNVYNILLIGTDQRPGDSRGRSDAMIILSINKTTQTVHLTSLMRAMYVAIPGKDWSMLNHSYSWGGSDLLLRTIENNLRISINDYMVVNFSGFTQAIDKVGKITINLTQAEASYLNNNTSLPAIFAAGDNQMDGDSALAYARIRKLDSDFHRTGRQRTVMESLIAKTRTLNALQMTDLAKSLLPLVNTNLSQGEMLSLMVDMMQARNYPVKQLMLPEAEYRERIYVRKMEMYRFNFTKTVETLHLFIYGQ